MAKKHFDGLAHKLINNTKLSKIFFAVSGKKFQVSKDNIYNKKIILKAQAILKHLIIQIYFNHKTVIDF
ncbi:MAG: hypothetical protein Kow0049_04860 [Stanieria sp.]